MTKLAEFAASVAPIELSDPLAEFLGFRAEGEVVSFTLEDAGRFAGHLCPTVATAFVMTRAALKRLYPDSIPVRGDIELTIASAPDQFANGPLARVIGYIIGAARDDGFRGLMGNWPRKDLLKFDPEATPFGSVTFKRTDTGSTVTITALAEKLPKVPEISTNLKSALEGDSTAHATFQTAWTQAVKNVFNAGEDFLEFVAG
ncbi:MAG: FmdE family protein [Planctomycetota bacterium]|jgi:formylmethanofuran dehydrogenase subunit E